jgi:hypothetical protein
MSGIQFRSVCALGLQPDNVICSNFLVYTGEVIERVPGPPTSTLPALHLPRRPVLGQISPSAGMLAAPADVFRLQNFVVLIVHFPLTIGFRLGCYGVMVLCW